jgi:hypothetical protein
VLRHPWLAALLLGTLATPAAVILAVPAPRPLDVVLAWPLVAMDVWVGQRQEGRQIRVLALIVGIALTWVFYVFLARLLVWRVSPGRNEGDEKT